MTTRLTSSAHGPAPLALRLALAAFLALGCGPATPGSGSDATAALPDATPSDAPVPCENGVRSCHGSGAVEECQDGVWVDIQTCTPNAQMCVDGVCKNCLVEFTIDTQQACSISLTNPVDGEAFITVQGQDHRVLALNRWGQGHIIAWCDSTTTPALLSAFDALGYLGQVASPRVASVGDDFLCTPTWLGDNAITYLGNDLPAQYLGNSAQLAADWDVIIFCAFRIPWTHLWTTELGEFVSVYGKGLLAASEYEGVAQAQDFANLSAITEPASIVFNRLNLPWAPASTSVSLNCVPDIIP